MKTIIIFILISSNLYCQSFDSLKKMDTIYIEINSTHELIFKSYNVSYLNNKTINQYFFNDKNGLKVHFTTYNDFNSLKSNFKVCNLKKFKKINKTKIITMEFLEENGIVETFLKQLNLNKKKIFIIDESDRKERKNIKRAISNDNRTIII